MTYAPCMVGLGRGGTLPCCFSGGGDEGICFMAE